VTDARDLWLAYAFKGLFEGALAGMGMRMFIVCGCRQSGLRDEFFTGFFARWWLPEKEVSTQLALVSIY
jgi:hypothetical protein